jgi:hypothetical protein
MVGVRFFPNRVCAHRRISAYDEHGVIELNESIQSNLPGAITSRDGSKAEPCSTQDSVAAIAGVPNHFYPPFGWSGSFWLRISHLIDALDCNFLDLVRDVDAIFYS